MSDSTGPIPASTVRVVRRPAARPIRLDQGRPRLSHYGPRLLLASQCTIVPLQDRGTFTLTVRLGRRFPSGKVDVMDSIDVPAIETCCPFLAVHAGTNARMERDLWTIAHVPTGYSMIRGLPTAEVARQVAGALSQLFPWQLEDSGRSVYNRMKRLPLNVQDWVKNWRYL